MWGKNLVARDGSERRDEEVTLGLVYCHGELRSRHFLGPVRAWVCEEIAQ